MTIDEFKKKYKKEIAKTCLKHNLASGEYAIAMNSDKKVFILHDIESIYVDEDEDGVLFWSCDCGDDWEVEHQESELVSDWIENFARFELQLTAEIIL